MPDSFTDVLADKFTFHAVDITRFEADAQSRTLQLLKDLEGKLTDDLERLDPTATTQTRRRLEALLKSVKANIQTAYSGIKREHRQDLIQLAETVSASTLDTINKAAKVSLLNVGVPKETLKALADDTLVQGAPAREWWSRQAGTTYQRFSTQIREGVYRGEPLSQLVARVKGTKDFDFKDGALAISRREAESLIRTSVQSVHNASRLETLQANEDVVKGVQALAVLDDRTSELCQARSGMSWYLSDGRPMDGNTNIDFPGPPPWHFNCRTVLIPVTFSWEELSQNKDLGKKVQKEVDQLPKSTQASMDGQVAADLNYEDWLKTKPEAFQRDILGDAKWQLWKEGKLTLKDMIDQKGRPLTIKELRDRLVGPPPTGGWKPAMTDDEAQAFVQDSVVKDELFYHHTSEEAAQKILDDGFRVGGGSIYGRGVYFTTSPTGLDTGASGLKLTGEGAVVTARLNATKVLETTTPQKFFKQLQQLGATPDEMQDATAFLQRKGYDAIRIARKGKADFFTVFNPKQVAAIKPPVTPIAPPTSIPPPTPPPPVPPPAPPPIPPAPSRVRSSRTTPPATPAGGPPWTTSTPGHEWHAATMTTAPDYVKRAIGTLPPVKKVQVAGQKSWYLQGTRTINLKQGSSVKNQENLNTWRHEYGHHVDNMLGNGRYISGTRTWEAAWKTDAKNALETAFQAGRNQTRDAADDRARTLVRQYKDIQAKQGFEAARTWTRDVFARSGLNFDDWSAMMSELVRKPSDVGHVDHLRLLAAYEQGAVTSNLLLLLGKSNVGHMGLQFMDTFGAITKEELGFGHGKPYYNRDSRNQGTEAFANVFSGLSHQNPMFTKLYERFFPNLTRLITGAMQNV